eukprot:71770-Rhodomonas_salina.1
MAEGVPALASHILSLRVDCEQAWLGAGVGWGEDNIKHQRAAESQARNAAYGSAADTWRSGAGPRYGTMAATAAQRAQWRSHTGAGIHIHSQHSLGQRWRGPSLKSSYLNATNLALLALPRTFKCKCDAVPGTTPSDRSERWYGSRRPCRHHPLLHTRYSPNTVAPEHSTLRSHFLTHRISS